MARYQSLDNQMETLSVEDEENEEVVFGVDGEEEGYI